MTKSIQTQLNDEVEELRSLVDDWQDLAVQIVEIQMFAAQQLALRLGHEDIDVGEPYRKMIARIKQGRC